LKAPYEFGHAIVREPAASVADGLRAVDRGNPDVGRFRQEHAAYCAALAAAGVEVIWLPALVGFPDSVFVEDPALVLPEAAILLRPGAESRAGEGEHLAGPLAAHRPLVRLAEGRIDGGDILVTGRELIVGLSARTDRTGVEALERCIGQWGYTVRCVALPPGLLHLKTGCSLLASETVLATGEMIASGLFDGYQTVVVPDGEAAAANAIRVNRHVLLAKGFPGTASLLVRLGYGVNTVPVAQAALLDGGLSCMSLRF
jgi:dimethylargininase